MNCNRCGAPINEGDQICQNCGESLTAFSHNQVVNQEIPTKVDSQNTDSVPELTIAPTVPEPVINDTPTEPFAPVEPVTNTVPEPVMNTASEPVINSEPSEPVTNPTPVKQVVNELPTEPTSEPLLTEQTLNTPLTSDATVAPRKEPMDKKKILTIALAALIILAVGAGIFFGIKLFTNNSSEPTPVDDEKEVEEEVLEERYYPIDKLTLEQVIAEYDYYRTESKKFNNDNKEDYEMILKAPASKVDFEDSTIKVTYTSYESKKIDHITSISILLLENNTETTMEIKTFDKTKADNLVSTFVNFYRPYCSKVDKYDNNSEYVDGYYITCSGVDVSIGYKVVNENEKVYYNLIINEEIQKES